MGQFKDLSKVIESMNVKSGIEIGQTLYKDRENFLNQKTLLHMKQKKYKKEYDDLFNHPENLADAGR